MLFENEFPGGGLLRSMCGNTDSSFFALDPKLVPKPEVTGLVISKIRELD
jgi:hypothetical protein